MNNPKFRIFLLLFALNLCSCESMETEPLEDAQLAVIDIISSECKETEKSTDVKQYVELRAIDGNNLQVKFINGQLNCCPGEIRSGAYIQDEILKVFFTEESALCDCICYYDLDCTVKGLEKRKYNLEIYVAGDKPDAKISFTFSNRLNMKIEI